MRITLIQPPKPSYGSSAEGHWELARPFSLFYLAAALETLTRHEVRILDLEKREHRGADFESVLRDYPADLFGLTAVTFSRFEAIRLAKAAKELQPGAFVVAGGVHFMHCAGDTLANVPEIDAVAHGEGESTLARLADAIDRGEDIAGIPGLSYRSGGRIVASSCEPLFDAFDDLPFYEKFSWDEYPEYLFGYPERLPAISVMSSRGCPYRCVFCAKSGSRYRLRDPGKVVDEIEMLKARFGVSCFNFLDLTFTAAPSHVEAVCRGIIERRLGIRWWCESRANIPLGLLATMREAGCVSTVIGVESGSPRILESIGKRITVEEVIAFCRECLRQGIIVKPYLMYSLPGETPGDTRLTVELMFDLMKMGVEPGGFQPTMIFPGTDLERLARDRGILPPDFSWCAPYDAELNRRLGQLPNVPLYTDGLDDAELLEVLETYRRGAGLYTASDQASRLTARELLRKAVGAVLHAKPSARYLVSPGFYAALARRKWMRKGT